MIRTIWITGASGYLGSYFCKYFKEKGFRVVAISRATSNEFSNGGYSDIDVSYGEFKNIDAYDWDRIPQPDFVLHTVSLDHTLSQSEEWQKVLDINVSLTKKFLDLSIKLGAKYFINFSTIHVVGRDQKDYSEEAMPTPYNVYGLTHLMAENVVTYFSKEKNIKGINVRLSNVFGAPLFSNSSGWNLVVNDLCRQAYVDHKMIVKSDGKAERDFIYIDDVGKALTLIFESDILDSSIYNISMGNSYSIKDVAHITKEIFNELFKKEIQVYLNGTSLSESNHFEKRNLLVPNRKIEDLGFNTSFDIRAGIKEVLLNLHGTNR